MRLFAAIELPEPVRRYTADVAAALKGPLCSNRVSWVPKANYHLTLKFFGDVPDPQVPALIDALKQVNGAGPIRLRATGFETFPPAGCFIRVLSLGVSGDVDALGDLVDRIEAACKPLGFPREPRLYHPHVTLGRAQLNKYPRQRLFDAMQAIKAPGPTFEVTEFVLMESRLKPTGPEYAPVARFPLRGSAGSPAL
jgi:2'-5' RNA ligase